MKRMIVLVNYAYTTDGVEGQSSKLVSVRFDERPSDLDVQELAEESIIKWFPTAYPGSKLDHVMATLPLEVTFPASKKKTNVEVPMGWFTNEQKPFVDDSLTDEAGTVSDYVLIDCDGKRETFVVGCWHQGVNGNFWSVDSDHEGSVEPENMRWSYLPLAKYER
jgi:hypothetical protein